MNFFVDLWHDLREKRLWPVAVGLLATAIAIPAILLKPAASPAPPPVVAVKPATPDALPAVQVDDTPTHGSKLQTFSTRNPFKPLAKLASSTPSSPAKSSSSSSSSSPSSGGEKSLGALARSAASSHGGSSSGSLGGGSTGGGSTGGGSTGSGGSPTGSSPSGGRQYYKFTADVSFGSLGHAHTFKGVDTGSSLTSNGHTELMFLGLADNAHSAIFFIADPALKARGEGVCDNKKDCHFVKLSLAPNHDEETFTASDGSVGYELKLLKLHYTPVSKQAMLGNTTPSKAPAGKAAASSPSDAVDNPLSRLITGAAGSSSTR